MMRIQNNGVIDIHFEGEPDNTASILLNNKMHAETLCVTRTQAAP